MTYTAFNDARSAAKPDGIHGLNPIVTVIANALASVAGSLCNRNPEMALGKEVMAGLEILA
jgi:hypothetical protein